MNHLTGAIDTNLTGISSGDVISISIPNEPTPLPQANLQQKSNVLNYHQYQLSINPKHKQSDTIKHFLKLNQFSISRSSLNRWISLESKIKEDALKLSSKSKSLTKVRKSIKPSMIKLQQFFKSNEQIIKCLEIYYVQNLLIQPNDLPLDKEIYQKFNEIRTLFPCLPMNIADQTGMFIDNESWPQYFKNQIIKYQIDSIQDNLLEQANISKISKVLIQEKDRLQMIFSDYKHENIYEFNEVILDLDRLYGLAELSESPENVNNLHKLQDNEHLQQLDQLQLDQPNLKRKDEFQQCELRKEYTVTLGVIGNVTGTDFPKPLIVSNLLGNSIQRSGNEFHYDPEGFNRREIFREYLHRWDTQLNSENRSVALLLDTQWSHFGLGEYRLQSFNNLKLVFINSKYDQTNSYFHRSQLRLPFSIGFERFLKYQLKTRLFKKFYKDTRVLSSKFEAFDDSIGILNNIVINYDLIIEKIKSDPTLKVFYKLGFYGSRLFEFDDMVNQLSAFESYANEFAQNGDEDAKSKNLYGRLTTFIRPLIPTEMKSKLQYSDTTRKLVVKEHEQELYQFIKTIVKAIIKLNPNRDYDSSQLMSNIVKEFTAGHNEGKYNKQYSMNAIIQYVKLTSKYKEQKEEIIKNNQNNKLYQKKLLEMDLEIDKSLLNDIQPFLYKSYLQGLNNLSSSSLVSSSSTTPMVYPYSAHNSNSNTGGNSGNDEHGCTISEETFKLFNKFYASYVNDTSVISYRRKHVDKRKKNSLINQNELLLQEQIPEQQIKKRLKLNKYITESDKSEDERDLERPTLSFSPQKPDNRSLDHNSNPLMSSMPPPRMGSIFARSLIPSQQQSQLLVNDSDVAHHPHHSLHQQHHQFVSSFLDSE